MSVSCKSRHGIGQPDSHCPPELNLRRVELQLFSCGANEGLLRGGVLGKFVLVHNGSTSGHNTGTHKVIGLAISR